MPSRSALCTTPSATDAPCHHGQSFCRWCAMPSRSARCAIHLSATPSAADAPCHYGQSSAADVPCHHSQHDVQSISALRHLPLISPCHHSQSSASDAPCHHGQPARLLAIPVSTMHLPLPLMCHAITISTMHYAICR